jgi:hypothetical protein
MESVEMTIWWNDFGEMFFRENRFRAVIVGVFWPRQIGVITCYKNERCLKLLPKKKGELGILFRISQLNYSLRLKYSFS